MKVDCILARRFGGSKRRGSILMMILRTSCAIHTQRGGKRRQQRRFVPASRQHTSRRSTHIAQKLARATAALMRFRDQPPLPRFPCWQHVSSWIPRGKHVTLASQARVRPHSPVPLSIRDVSIRSRELKLWRGGEQPTRGGWGGAVPECDISPQLRERVELLVAKNLYKYSSSARAMQCSKISIASSITSSVTFSAGMRRIVFTPQPRSSRLFSKA